MLLQTNSYIVPADRRAEHERLIRRFRLAMTRIGCDSFDVYEQVGPNWSSAETTGRFVQIMRFRDRKHQMAVQAAERNDATAQALIAEFCELINLPYQQQQGLFAVGFYRSVVAGHEREAAHGQHPLTTEEEAAPVEQAVVEEPAPVEEREFVEPREEAPQEYEQPAPEVDAADQEYGMPARAAPEHQLSASDNGPLQEQTAQVDELEFDNTELEIDTSIEEQPISPPPLEEIDIEALAQEEMAEGQKHIEDRDRSTRG